MKTRTLVTHRRYFGVEAVPLREATGRVLARVVGLPLSRARISGRQLRNDFGVDTVSGRAVVARLVAGGLLRPHAGAEDDYEVTERLVEFAAARVVEPLARAKARRLVARAIDVAESINAHWTRNPLAIARLATCGDYLTEDAQLAELRLGVIVYPRPQERMSRWRAARGTREGTAEIRAAFEATSSFVRATLTDDAKTLPRPFSIAWKEDATH